MIQLIDLTKQYKGIRAVDGISLNVRKGARFGFLGPNGAGKTTTIKMMAGVLQPTAGRIVINGHDMAASPTAVKACIGFIPDRPFMYEKLTGLEFLHFVTGLYGLQPTPLLGERMASLLTLFELAAWKDELIESYSHGMKQRLIMCSALIHEPKVLIVDEPMVGLDPRGARLVKNIFKEQSQNGTTLFMSTHSLEVAEEVCEEIAIIQRGRVIAQGAPAELRQQTGVDGKLEDVFLSLTQDKVGWPDDRDPDGKGTT
jgi:ABC-2 type transport system ATP-binding protein